MVKAWWLTRGSTSADGKDLLESLFYDFAGKHVLLARFSRTILPIRDGDRGDVPGVYCFDYICLFQTIKGRNLIQARAIAHEDRQKDLSFVIFSDIALCPDC